MVGAGGWPGLDALRARTVAVTLKSPATLLATWTPFEALNHRLYWFGTRTSAPPETERSTRFRR
jgi:hypothetical protein